MSTYKSISEAEEMLNWLLISIVIAAGGVVTGNDRNTLLKDWLRALEG